MSASGALPPARDLGDRRTRLPRTASPSSRPTPFDLMCVTRGSSTQGLAASVCNAWTARLGGSGTTGRGAGATGRCLLGASRAASGRPTPWHPPCSTCTAMTERVSAVKLLPLDSAEAIELVAGWLSKYDNYKWLDFGNGVQRLTPVSLRVMTQRALHEFRIYTADDGDVPAGVVGLTNVDRNFKTASIWAVLGNKRY